MEKFYNYFSPIFNCDHLISNNLIYWIKMRGGTAKILRLGCFWDVMMWKSVQKLNIQYQPRISLQIRVALSSLLIFLDHGNDLLLLQSCPISSRISEPRSFPPRLSFKLPLTEKPSNEKRELLLASRPAHETKLQEQRVFRSEKVLQILNTKC